MRKFAIVLLALFVIGCPDPQTGKVNPYLTARTVINQANIALSLSNGIFMQWLIGQTDAEKAKKSQEIYQKVSTGVANGLQIALNGVAIAEQAKTDPDITKLMAEASVAWDSLRKFLEDLFSKPEDASLVEIAIKPAPAPAPTGEVAISTSALTSAAAVKKSPLEALPKKLY